MTHHRVMVGQKSATISPRRRPDLFLVGAPKCGTTALSDYLSQHPDIFMARKEMHFFGADLRFARHFYRRDEAEYLAQYAARNNQPRAGEASVWYLFSKTAAAEIKAFNPEARIIVMLREPVGMIYSLFHYFRFDGNENLPTFEAALAAEDDRHAGRRLGRQTYLAQGLVYRETASYSEQVRRFFDAFGRERVRVILYDDFAADPARAYTETLRFLEVDPWASLPEFKRINGSQSAKLPLMRALLNDPALRSAILAARPLMPRTIFSALGKIESRLRRLNSRPEKYPPLDPALRARLQDEFAPEVERLGRLLGRDLTHWTNRTPVPPEQKQLRAHLSPAQPALSVAPVS